MVAEFARVRAGGLEGRWTMKHKGINHFGIWLKQGSVLRLTRENFAVINKQNSFWCESKVECYRRLYPDLEVRRRFFDDDECRIYSDAWCEEWRDKCLTNFDLNMRVFSCVDKQSFDAVLSNLLYINRKIETVEDLTKYEGVPGLYIMVLDEYRQVYVGQSGNIRKGIVCHWARRVPFDRLLHGDVEESVLPIDCFGALDTTRIFVLRNANAAGLSWFEAAAVRQIPDVYRLNRMGGGSLADAVSVLSTVNRKSFEG